MPTQRITKEMLLNAAMDLLEEQGQSAVTVMAVSKRAGCSPQPVYSSWRNMKEMWWELSKMVSAKVQALAAEHIDPEDPFRSIGQAYATVARENPHLFLAFAAARRPPIHSLKEFMEDEADPEVTRNLKKRLGISLKAARQLHLHLLIYTTGVCTIYTACSPEMPLAKLFNQMEGAYEAFAAQASGKE